MARNFRESRFRGRRNIGEDVNPSAYIVNLADCMLVLALGFMVALISYWNVNITPVTDLDESNMEEVDPSTLPKEMIEGGSYFIEAGKVYQDPNTGELFMVEEVDEEGNTVASKHADGSGGSTDADASKSDDAAVAAARAQGAD
ncbi:MAG: hypothetical protein PUA57_05805 [Eggerthellales bacterium]|nr:hypothetical protein [Eggerthellales bacterium]